MYFVRKNQQISWLHSDAGFTLLEVMVTIFVLAIGLLGLASLQVISVRLSDDSMLRTNAAILANDMMDRMRANPAATMLGTTSPYNNPSMAATANLNCLGVGSTGNQINTICNSTEMAQNDFYEWYMNMQGAGATSWHPAVSASLPSATGVVCVDSTPQDGTPTSPACDNIVAVPGKVVFAVKIWWVERQDPQSPSSTHQYVANFSL